jgi:hypothetical protein
MEFDTFGLSVKDLSTQNMIIRSNGTSPLYMLHLPGSTTPSVGAMAALLLHHTPLLLSLLPHGIIVSVTLTLMPYLDCLDLPLFTVPAINMSFVMHVS